MNPCRQFLKSKDQEDAEVGHRIKSKSSVEPILSVRAFEFGSLYGLDILVPSPTDPALTVWDTVCLEVAIAALGEFPDPSVLKALQDALKKAQEGASVPPVGVRLDSCAQFVERARRRLAKAEVEFNRVQEERALRATELAEGLARLETLRAEAAVSGVPQVSPHPPQDVGHLQEVIRDLQAEVASLRARHPEAEEDLTRKKSRVAAPCTPLAILNGGTPQ